MLYFHFNFSIFLFFTLVKAEGSFIQMVLQAVASVPVRVRNGCAVAAPRYFLFLGRRIDINPSSAWKRSGRSKDVTLVLGLVQPKCAAICTLQQQPPAPCVWITCCFHGDPLAFWTRYFRLIHSTNDFFSFFFFFFPTPGFDRVAPKSDVDFKGV